MYVIDIEYVYIDDISKSFTIFSGTKKECEEKRDEILKECNVMMKDNELFFLDPNFQTFGDKQFLYIYSIDGNAVQHFKDFF